MLRKLMIRTWFGPLPEWMPKFEEHIERGRFSSNGWDFLLWNDLEEFKNFTERQTGIRPMAKEGTRKAGDYDPYLGEILRDRLRNYDYWGHYNLDAVYGRLDRWIPDDFLGNLDVFGNDPGAICGPFTVYRNCNRVNSLFRRCPTWEDNLRDPNFRGWDELDFNRTVQSLVLKGEVVMGSGFFQSHDHIDDAHRQRQEVRILDDGTLIDCLTEKEILMYHFNASRKWPVV